MTRKLIPVNEVVTPAEKSALNNGFQTIAKRIDLDPPSHKPDRLVLELSWEQKMKLQSAALSQSRSAGYRVTMSDIIRSFINTL